MNVEAEIGVTTTTTYASIDIFVCPIFSTIRSFSLRLCGAGLERRPSTPKNVKPVEGSNYEQLFGTAVGSDVVVSAAQ